jgi:hypothetical protein
MSGVYICNKCGIDLKHQSSLRKHYLRKTPCMKVFPVETSIKVEDEDDIVSLCTSNPIQIYDKVEPKRFDEQKLLANWLWREISKTPANICFVFHKNRFFVKRKTKVEVMDYNGFIDLYIRNIYPLGPGEIFHGYEDYMKKIIIDFFEVMPGKIILLNRIKRMDPSLNYI